MRRSLLSSVIVAIAVSCLSASAGASTTWQLCPGVGEQIECASYSLPLDRTGALTGTTTVRATRIPASEGPRMGTLFVIAGGPGQGSAAMLGLMTSGYFYGANRYDIIAVDQRGAGSSEPLVCPRIEGGSYRWDGGDPATDRAITDCSNSLGPARAAYNTFEAVEDIEAIRADLGIDNATFFGVSYGTKVALAYAKAHPSRTKALLLDSVVPTDAPESFDVDSLAALRGTLGAICTGRRCSAAGGVPTAGIERLAKRLAKRPIGGQPTTGSGQIIPPLDDDGLYGIVFAADTQPFFYNQLPSAISGALRGNSAQLERLYAIASGVPVTPRARELGEPGFSNTMFLATTCADLNPPWTRGDELTGRQGAIDAAASAIDAAALIPFPRSTVSANSTTAICRGWHQTPVAPAIAQGPLPQIPTLALAGSLDLRTPTAWATRAVAGDSLAQIVTIPNVGHSTIGMDLSGCALSLARRFLIFGATDGKCKKTAPPIPVAPRAVRRTAAVTPAPGSCAPRAPRRCRAARKQLTAAYLALRDTLDQAMIGGGDSGPGLYDGYWDVEYDLNEQLELIPTAIKLHDVSNVIGSNVSGSINVGHLPSVNLRLRTSAGTVRVRGRIAFDRGSDRLTLSGKRVRIRIRPRSQSASHALVATRARLAFRRSYTRAASPSIPRPGR
jgi:pimeloyl-ACP methyl ester carboxylesterase